MAVESPRVSLTARVPGRVLGDVCLLGVTHAVVDAASALTVLRAGGDLTWHLSPYLLVILYDLLAFGLHRLYSDGLLFWLAIASAVVFWFALRQVQRFGDGRLDP